MIPKRFAFPLVLAVAVLVSTVAPALAGPEKVGPLLHKYTGSSLRYGLDPVPAQVATGVMSSAEAGLGVRALIQGNVTRAQLEAMGVTVTSHAGTVFSAYIPPSAVRAVSDLPGIIRIQAAHTLKPNLDVATAETQIIPKVHGQSAPYGGNTGSNVVLGVVDSGFDYKSADFRTAADQSRFVNIWDQTVSGTAPLPFGYGAEYSQAQLTANTPTITNPDGHGTHVTGICGGNGRGTGNAFPQYRYTGVAPEATLIGVKTDFSDAGIMDGVDYVFQKAAALGKSAVVNLSLGGQYGPHDGTDPLDVGLSALTGAGKIVVAAAGNERGAQIHARAQIPVSGAPSLRNMIFNVGAYSASPGSQNDLFLFDGFYESTDNYTVTVSSPNGHILGPIALGNSNAISTADGAIEIDNGISTSSSGDYEVFVAFYDYNAGSPPAAGNWTITFTRVSSTNSNIDLWNYYESSSTGKFTTFYTDDVTVGSPGSGQEVICVAAYTGKKSWQSIDGNTYSYTGAPALGVIAPFSSRGPLRDGTQKPDIAAPGFGIMSTLASDVPSNAASGNQPLIDPDGKHWMEAGTSMASPMVAGLVALILDAQGALTPVQMKTQLSTFARTDVYTGSVPNYDFGYGKISGEPADVTAPTVAVTAPNGGESYVPGQAVAVDWTATDNFSVDHVDIFYSSDGGSSFSSVATGQANSGSYAWTAPAGTTTMGRIRVVAYDALSNSAADTSDANFTIQATDSTPPAVAVTAPNGGEMIPAGSSTDITWTASDTGAKPSGVSGLAAVLNGVDSVRVSYSLNGGSTWTIAATGIDNTGTYSWTTPNSPSDSVLVRVQAWDPSNNLGSDQSDAAFHLTSATGIAEQGLPTVLTLAQNRPNPMGAAGTRISFGLTRPGPVTLRIYDAAGRQVAMVVDGTFGPGFHSVEWDGKLQSGERASNGLYFYRLETKEGTVNRKLMVVR